MRREKVQIIDVWIIDCMTFMQKDCLEYSHDYLLNCTQLGPVTIIYQWHENSLLVKWIQLHGQMRDHNSGIRLALLIIKVDSFHTVLCHKASTPKWINRGSFKMVQYFVMIVLYEFSCYSRGYYMAEQRFGFHIWVVKTVFYKWVESQSVLSCNLNNWNILLCH